MKKNLDFMMTSEGRTLALRSMKISAAVPIRKSSELVTKRWKFYKKDFSHIQEFVWGRTVEPVQPQSSAVAIAKAAKFRRQDLHGDVAGAGTIVEGARM